MKRGLLILVAIVGCGDDSGSIIPDAAAPGDARVDGPRPDAGPFNCATSPTAGTHRIFLAFDGVSLTRATSDSALNQFSVIDPSITTAVIPAWKTGAADRAAQIQTIVCMMRQALYAFDVEVVTTRPATGDYEMIVFGGSPSDLGFSSQGLVLTSLSAKDCANANQRDVAWVAERPDGSFTLTASEAANGASAMHGVGNGLAASTIGTNCMCAVAVPYNCDTNATCSFSTTSPIAPNGGNFCSAPGTTENQVAKLLARFGARP